MTLRNRSILPHFLQGGEGIGKRLHHHLMSLYRSLASLISTQPIGFSCDFSLLNLAKGFVFQLLVDKAVYLMGF